MGREDDWEQIAARDRRENKWHLRIKIFRIFFMRVESIAEREIGQRFVIGSRSLLGIRERKIGDDRILRRNQTPLTQQFIAGIEDR